MFIKGISQKMFMSCQKKFIFCNFILLLDSFPDDNFINIGDMLGLNKSRTPE